MTAVLSEFYEALDFGPFGAARVPFKNSNGHTHVILLVILVDHKSKYTIMESLIEIFMIFYGNVHSNPIGAA